MGSNKPISYNVHYVNFRKSTNIFLKIALYIARHTATVWVKRGKVRLEAFPASITAGQTTTITIRAWDTDFGFEMNNLSINGPNGYVGKTGQSFQVTPAVGTASPITFTIDTEGYDQGLVIIPIIAPTPPPSASLTITTNSTIGVQNQVITAIEWTLLGGGQSITRDMKPNTDSCSLSIPIPTPSGNSKVIYYLTGKATIEFIQPGTGNKLTRQVMVFSVYNGLQDSIIIEWDGQPQFAEINISWRPVYDSQTVQQIDEVFCFVLNKLT